MLRKHSQSGADRFHFGFRFGFHVLLGALLFMACGGAQAAPRCESLFRVGKRNSNHPALSLETYLREIHKWNQEPAASGASQNRKLRIEVTDSAAARDGETVEVADEAEPYLLVKPEERLLVVPRSYLQTATDDGFQAFYRQLLIGTRLHPYNSVDSGQIPLGANPDVHPKRKQLRRVQREGIKAAQLVQKAGLRKFLFVSPTATGKSEVLIEVLQERVLSRPEKLHIITADLTHLIERLADKFAQELGDRAQIIRWGGANSSQPLSQIIELAHRSGKPVILVSTIQSLKTRFSEYDAHVPNLNELHSVLSTFAYDEAHHLGAEQTEALTKRLVDAPDSKAFLLGTTATPIHRISKIESLFGGQGFWAYLDTATAYIKRVRAGRAPLIRPLASILDQLEMAINEGDLTPFDQFHLLQPRYIDGKSKSENRPWRVDDADVLAKLRPELAPLFTKHQRGFISVPSIGEAEALTAFLRSHMSLNAQVLHSRQSLDSQKSIEQDFRRGKINYLVTVRKLDEGMDYPDLSLYIDLNRSLGIRQLLQRIGRVLRIYEGKEGVDIAMMVDVDQATARDAIELFERIRDRGFHGSRQSLPGEGASEAENRLSQILTTLKSLWGANRKFVSFADAQKWAQEQGIKTWPEWRERRTQGDWPDDIPRNPHVVYKRLGWKGWRHFLGTESATYEEARDWAQNEGIHKSTEWDARTKQPDWPAKIPKNPDEVYAGKGWVSWPRFLGTEYVSFEEAMDWAQKKGIESSTEWDALARAPNWPEDVPRYPDETYAKKGWKGWRHFLGTENVSYEEAKKFARQAKIESSTVWNELKRLPGWPKNIPQNPKGAYAKSGWEGWPKFLGTYKEKADKRKTANDRGERDIEHEPEVEY